MGAGTDLVDQLYRGQFDGVAPSVDVSEQGGEATVKVRMGRRRGPPRLMAPGRSRLDLSPVTGGVNELDLVLGEPSGVVALSVTGGVNALKIARPAAVRVDVGVRGGASRVVLDGRKLAAVAQGLWLGTHGDVRGDPGSARYELTVNGGAHQIHVAPLP